MDQEEVLAGLVSGLKALAPEARASVEKKVRQAVLASTASDILTFRVGSGPLLTPAASSDYAQALWCFLRGKTLNGTDVESLVNETVLAAVQEALTEILLSDRAMSAMVGPVAMPEIDDLVDGATRGLTADEIAWLRREVSALLGVHGTQTIQTKVAVAAADNAALFLKSAAGATMLKIIAHLVSTTAGKVMVAKLLHAAAAKAAASAAFKALAIGFVKKAGLVVLIKAAVGAAVAAGLPMHRLNRLPPILLPVALVAALGFFLVHELRNMPNKLAQSLPGEVAARIEAEWSNICEGFISALTAEAFETVVSGFAGEATPAGTVSIPGSTPLLLGDGTKGVRPTTA